MIKEQRPWGYYINLIDGLTYKVKKIVVHPGEKLSLQSHNQRDEHWYIVHGKAEIRIDHSYCRVEEGSNIDIKKGQMHRIENIGTMDLMFIEVQTGDYLGGDDIIRYEDKYGRN